MYQGHRSIRLPINKNTSVVGTFTTKSSYFSIPLLPAWKIKLNLVSSTFVNEEKIEYLKLNVITHTESFRFQKDFKRSEYLTRKYNLNFGYYYAKSYIKPLPV